MDYMLLLKAKKVKKRPVVSMGQVLPCVFLFQRIFLSVRNCFYSFDSHSLSGIAVGHLYYFLEDVFPNQPNGFRLLKTPFFL